MKTLLFVLAAMLSVFLIPSVEAGDILYNMSCGGAADSGMPEWIQHLGDEQVASPTSTIHKDGSGNCTMDFSSGGATSTTWTNIVLNRSFNVPAFEGISVNVSKSCEGVTSSRCISMFLNSSIGRDMAYVSNNTGSLAGFLTIANISANSVYTLSTNTQIKLISTSTGTPTELDAAAFTTGSFANWFMWMNHTHAMYKYNNVVLYNDTQTCDDFRCFNITVGLQISGNVGSSTDFKFKDLLIFEGQSNPVFPTPPPPVDISVNYTINISDFNQPGERVNSYEINISNGTQSFIRSSASGITTFPDLQGSYFGNISENTNSFINRNDVALTFNSLNQSRITMWRAEKGVTALSSINNVSLLFNISVNSGLEPPQNATDVFTFVFKSTDDPYSFRINTSGFAQQIIAVSPPPSLSQTNITVNFTSGDINVTAADLLTGVPVTNFTLSVTSFDYPTFNEVSENVNGSFVFAYLNGTYEFNATAFGFNTISFNKTFGSDGDVDLIINLSRFNSLFLNTFDEITKALLLNNSVEVFSDSFSQNFTTLTGNVTIQDLEPNDYTIRYRSPDYLQRLYFFTLANQTSTNISLFLLTTGNSTLVDLNVKDQTFNNIEGAIVQALRFNVITNSFDIVQMVSTNFDGNAQFNLELFQENYKFIIIQGGVVRVETIPTTITDTDATNGLQFTINTAVNVLEQIQDLASIQTRVFYSNNSDFFGFTFTNPLGTNVIGCLEVSRILSNGRIVVNSTCVTSASASIQLNINSSKGGTFLGVGTISDGTNTFPAGSFSQTFSEIQTVFGLQMVFYAILLLGTFTLVFARNPKLLIVFAPLALFATVFFGILVVSYAVVFTLVVLGFIGAAKMRNNET